MGLKGRRASCCGKRGVRRFPDRAIPNQHNLARYNITVLVLAARSNALEDLAPLVPKAIEALRSARQGVAVHVTVVRRLVIRTGHEALPGGIVLPRNDETTDPPPATHRFGYGNFANYYGSW